MRQGTRPHGVSAVWIATVTFTSAAAGRTGRVRNRHHSVNGVQPAISGTASVRGRKPHEVALRRKISRRERPGAMGVTQEHPSRRQNASLRRSLPALPRPNCGSVRVPRMYGSVNEYGEFSAAFV